MDVYNFSLTESQIEQIKAALRLSGLEIIKNREIYKLLCEAVCDEEDVKLLKRYNG